MTSRTAVYAAHATAPTWSKPMLPESHSMAIVATPIAIVYAEPEPQALIVTDVIHGAALTVARWHAGWAYVVTSDHCVGWIRTDDVRPSSRADRPEHLAWVTALAAHVYPEPCATKQAPLMTLPFEASIALCAQPHDPHRWWCRVRLVDGREGWMRTAVMTRRRARVSLPQLVACALRFVGVPFRWGGTSSFGFDCSGLVQMLYRQWGIALPRRAHAQASWTGCHTVTSDSRPGDLLFFGKPDTGIAHEGMCLGGSLFIHATNFGPPVIKLSSLDEPRWQSRLYLRRRLATDSHAVSEPELIRAVALADTVARAAASMPPSPSDDEDD